MLELLQKPEDRRQRAQISRAERAFDSARTLPLQMQQDMARLILEDCARSATMQSSLPRHSREQAALYRLQIAGAEQKTNRTLLAAGGDETDPDAACAILAQLLLSVSGGLVPDRAAERLAEDVARWTQRILPEQQFAQFEARLPH